MEETDPQAGKLREELNWIGGDSPVTAIFVPPEHTRVPIALDDLVRFMERTDIAAIVQSAIAHAQFETIHPFTDGNGRTGRALVSAILRARGTTKNFTVPLSSGLLTSTEDYFSALNEYRRGNIEPIIVEFVGAARRAMASVQVLMHDLERLRKKILNTGQRKTKNLRIVAELCITEPAFTAQMVGQLGVPVSSAYTIINRLVEAKILREERKIGGQSVWSVVGLTDALDAFAERAGNRTAMWL
jgi:Fic family protein